MLGYPCQTNSLVRAHGAKVGYTPLVALCFAVELAKMNVTGNSWISTMRLKV